MKRTKTFGIRMTDQERKNLEREAKKRGLSLASYLRYLSSLKPEIKVSINK